MRICLLTPYFLPGIGGVELSLHYLASHLSRLGHKVTVLTATRQKTPSGTLNPFGYQVYSWHRFVFPLIREKNDYNEKNILANISLHWARQPFDILNAHFTYPTGYAATLWGQDRQPAVVITGRGVDVQKIPELNNYGYRYHRETEKKIRTALALADLTTGISRQIVKDTVDAGSPRSRTVLIPNGIEIEKQIMPPPFDFPYILYLGRLDHIKGVDLLLKSFLEVCHYDHSIKLVVTGSGPSLHSLVDQALSLRIGERVIFTGTKTGQCKAALFQHCRFFVCPSRTESLGCANIEALAYGKPVIAYRVGGIPDVIKNGENGFLVTPHDISEFAARMLELLQKPELTKRLGQTGKKIARNYYWPDITQRYLEAYRKAIENRAGTRS